MHTRNCNKLSTMPACVDFAHAAGCFAIGFVASREIFRLHIFAHSRGHFLMGRCAIFSSQTRPAKHERDTWAHASWPTTFLRRRHAKRVCQAESCQRRRTCRLRLSSDGRRVARGGGPISASSTCRKSAPVRHRKVHTPHTKGFAVSTTTHRQQHQGVRGGDHHQRCVHPVVVHLEDLRLGPRQHDDTWRSRVQPV